MSSSIIRVVECSYNTITDQVILSLDVRHPSDSDLDRCYVVVAPSKEVRTQEALQSFVESDILSQREATPNWTGVSWRSMKI